MDRTVRGARIDLQCWWHRRGVRIVGTRKGIVVYDRPRYGLPGPAVVINRIEEDYEATVKRVSLAAMCCMKKPETKSDSPRTPVPMKDIQAEQKWPTLWEHLTHTTYDDGSPREPSSLLIFLQDGSLKGMLREKNTSECLWAAGRGLIPLLDVIEFELTSEAPDWRPDRKGPGESAPRRRK